MTRGVKWLLGVSAATSLLVGTYKQWIDSRLGALVVDTLEFRAGGVLSGKLWQLGTYSFINLDVFGLLIGLWMVWSFGSTLERRWGTRRLLTFFLGTTILAAAVTTLIGLAAPGLRSVPYAGLWTGVEALAAAFAIHFGDQQINVFFVLPLQARYLIHLALGITVITILMTGSVLPYVLPTLGLVAGIVFAKGALNGPRHLLLRLRVWLIERKLSSRKLRIVQGTDEPPPPTKPGPRPKSGSDGYLH